MLVQDIPHRPRLTVYSLFDVIARERSLKLFVFLTFAYSQLSFSCLPAERQRSKKIPSTAQMRSTQRLEQESRAFSARGVRRRKR